MVFLNECILNAKCLFKIDFLSISLKSHCSHKLENCMPQTSNFHPFSHVNYIKMGNIYHMYYFLSGKVCLLLTVTFARDLGTHLIHLRKGKDWTDFGAIQWFWVQDSYLDHIGNKCSGQQVIVPLKCYNITSDIINYITIYGNTQLLLQLKKEFVLWSLNLGPETLLKIKLRYVNISSREKEEKDNGKKIYAKINMGVYHEQLNEIFYLLPTITFVTTDKTKVYHTWSTCFLLKYKDYYDLIWDNNLFVLLELEYLIYSR